MENEKRSAATEKKDHTATPKNSGRRKAFKTLIGGTSAIVAYHVLPDRWSRPIIEQVILPANAQTSGVSLSDPCSTSLLAGDQTTAMVSIQVSGFVSPPTSGLPVEIVATPAGAGSPVTRNSATDASGNFIADILITGGPGITAVSVTTSVTGASGTATCQVNIPAPTTTTTTTPALSDRRLKTDISFLDTSPDGIRLYKFRYIDDPSKHEYVGVMAQDLVQSHPEALTKDEKGYYGVYYGKLGLKMARFEAWQKSGMQAIMQDA